MTPTDDRSSGLARFRPGHLLAVLGLIWACGGGSAAFGQGGNFDGFGNLIEAESATPTAAPLRARG